MRFARQYARKKTRDHDPNDRQYSRKVEQQVRRMKSEELDQLLHGNDDE
jgi:hypothetical protein